MGHERIYRFVITLGVLVKSGFNLHSPCLGIFTVFHFKRTNADTNSILTKTQ